MLKRCCALRAGTGDRVEGASRVRVAAALWAVVGASRLTRSEELRVSALCAGVDLAVALGGFAGGGVDERVAAVGEALLSQLVSAAASRRDALRQAGAWGLGVVADTDASLAPRARRALCDAIRSGSRDEQGGTRDMALENAVGAALKLLTAQSGCDGDADAARALAAAAAAALPLHLDLAEARDAHARALEAGLLPRELSAALATAELPAPAWATGLLRADEHSVAPGPEAARRLRRRFGNDRHAATTAALETYWRCQLVDAQTRQSLQQLYH